MMKAAGMFLALALGGCAASGAEGPSFTPSSAPSFRPVPVNQAPRGSEEFCRTYADQSARNRFETERSADSDGIAYVSARRAGEDAYRRCRSGRTN